MVSTVIQEMLYNNYFWFIAAFGLIVVIHFARKKSPPPFPGAGKFFKKHKKGITKIFDILAICIVLLWSYILLPFAWDNFRNPIESESTRKFIQQSDLMFTFMLLTVWSGTSGFFVGLLSVFQSNITKIKRIILLIVCLLPIVFTILDLLTDITESPWLIVQLCIYFSAGSWMINMPAVLVGKSFSELSENILKKLKLMFSHHAG